MRYVVLSDTHGDLRRIFAAVDYIRALGADEGLSLGDLCCDASLLEKELRIPFRAVAGNCDAGMTRWPDEDVVMAEGARIFISHGHRFDVYEGPQRLIWAAQERECTVALYGHTHRQELLYEQGVLVMNPGSLCRPRASEAGFGLLDVKNGQAKGLLLPFCGQQEKGDSFFW